MAPTTTPKCHPCRAKGMKQINYFITPERKSKLVHYCHMRGISITSLLSTLTARELEQHYDNELIRYSRKQLHRRAKAYRYLRSRYKL